MTPLPEPSGIVFDIMRFSTRDGPGIRTTVFLKGCPLACWWCHNPESQRQERELMLRPNLCIGCLACLEACPEGAITSGPDGPLTDAQKCRLCGTCQEYCYSDARQIVGRTMTVSQVMAEIRKDIPFYDESGGGVTFSGGEPLLQNEFLGALLRACKDEDLHTAVDTCGSVPWSVMDGLRADVDLFLYDLKALDDEIHLKYTGASNQRILENLVKLSERKQKVRVRAPLIPGINDSPDDLRRLVDFVAGLPNPAEVEMLPYHTAGVEKYRRLGRDYPLDGAQPYPSELEHILKRVVRSHNITP
jgi:pyruvate formate lyase activating enzyme